MNERAISKFGPHPDGTRDLRFTIAGDDSGGRLPIRYSWSATSSNT